MTVVYSTTLKNQRLQMVNDTVASKTYASSTGTATGRLQRRHTHNAARLYMELEPTTSPEPLDDQLPTVDPLAVPTPEPAVAPLGIGSVTPPIVTVNDWPVRRAPSPR